MTAALKHPALLEAEPVLDPLEWIDAREAAEKMGLNAGSMRRKCPTLETQNKAKKATPPEGGQSRWYIHRSYHPALAFGKAGEGQTIPQAFFSMPRAKQDLAWKKKACVDALRHAREHRPGAVKEWIGSLVDELRDTHRIKISKGSLYRWDSAYRKPADILKFTDARGGDQKSKGDPAAWQFFRDIYLDQKRPTKKRCYDLTAAKAEDKGWQWPSYATVRRRLNEVIPPETQLYHRDRKKWLSQMQPGIEQDPDAWPAGELWESDHAQIDVICKHGQETLRPWITVWFDWRTRKVVGHVVSTSPNGSTIQAALRQALMDESNKGGPDTVRIDNGKDYQGKSFHGQTRQWRNQIALEKGYLNESTFGGIYGLLDIDVIFTIPRGPNGKSRCERWFGTLHSMHDREYDTFTGSTPTDRPFGHEQVMRTPSRVPTFEQLKQSIADTIAAYNDRADHQIDDLAEGGVKISPNQAMERWASGRVYPDQGVLDLACGMEWPGIVYAGRNGITIRPFGVPISYGGMDTRLTPYKARLKKDRKPLVVAYDPDDASALTVWEADGMKLVGVFKENEKGAGIGADRSQAKKLIADKRRYEKALKDVKEGRPRDLQTTAQRLRFNERQRRKKLEAENQPTEPPPSSPGGLSTGSVRLAQTPLDGQSQRVRLTQQRVAAGAEGQRNPQPLPDITELVTAASERDALDAAEMDASAVIGGINVDLSDLTGGGDG